MNDKVRSFILFLEKDKIFFNFFFNRFFSKNNLNLLKKKKKLFSQTKSMDGVNECKSCLFRPSRK